MKCEDGKYYGSSIKFGSIDLNTIYKTSLQFIIYGSISNLLSENTDYILVTNISIFTNIFIELLKNSIYSIFICIS